VRLVVQGKSMSPSLKKGEVVVVCGLTGDQLLIGDIVILQLEGELITHRIVARRTDGWYTKGDGSPRLDPLVRLEAILGWVEAYEHDGAVYSTRGGKRKLINSIIGSLSWLEGAIYRVFDGIGDSRTRVVRGIGRIIVLPLRMTIWCLAKLWR